MSDADRSRLIEAEWRPDTTVNESYSVEINIYANNRTGLLVDVLRIFTEHKINMTSINSRTNKQGIVTMSISFNVHSTSELNELINKIRPVESILDIERTTG